MGCEGPGDVTRQCTHHIHSAEDMAVVMAGLQVLGDVGKRAEILRVLGSTGDVPDLVLSNDILPGSTTSTRHPSGDGKYTQQTGAGEGVLGTGKGGVSQPDQSLLPPKAGRNGNVVHKQPVCQAFGTQVIITTLVFSPSPRSSPGPAVAFGATKRDLQPPGRWDCRLCPSRHCSSPCWRHR